MMDHLGQPHKPNDREKNQRDIRDQGKPAQSDYYYDDATNYEIYRDESDEPAEPDQDGTGS
jgi:hypothetical protein